MADVVTDLYLYGLRSGQEPVKTIGRVLPYPTPVVLYIRVE